MIRVNTGEAFPILVSLLDETTGSLVSGQMVTYDIRTVDDSVLSPPVSGTLIESTVSPGLYKITETLSNPGVYICYATCSGYLTNTEEIMVNEYNIYDMMRSNRHYNISVEDVTRSTVTPTESQVARNVPFNKTDYILTKIKGDDALDWTNPIASGIIYAWYESIDSSTPFRMGGPD